MGTSVVFWLVVLMLLVLLPSEILLVIRKIKRWLKDDIRKRVTASQWVAIRREFNENDL